MGGEAFKCLLERTDEVDVVLLLRPSTKNKTSFKRYERHPAVNIVWGDLYDPKVMAEAVRDIDVVLHPAAIISPAADRRPAQAYRTNVGGTRNVIDAIKQQPNGAERIRLVSVGSVAMYGDRLPPHHLIKVGDPLKPCWGDHYALSKIAAERAVIESGIKHWASLRQTYIAIPNLISLVDPIMFHQPLNTHMELITSQDAGYGLARAIDAPDEFFGHVYNMSGGPSCRVVYDDYIAGMMEVFGLGDYRTFLEANWFALANFHCGYFLDSHVLDEYLGHFRQSLDDHYAQVSRATPWALKAASRVAPSAIVKSVMHRMAEPLRWLERDDSDAIKAFFGGRKQWSEIPGWDELEVNPLERHPVDAPVPKLRPDLIEKSPRELAEARGGECLSDETDDRYAVFTWRCGQGHSWKGTAAAVEAGHWCSACSPPPWDHDGQAAVDPLLASVHRTHRRFD